MVRTLSFHCQGLGLIRCRGTKILQATRCGQKIFLNKIKDAVAVVVQSLSRV